MKVKFGAIVTDGRGKIGGHVLTKNRQGAAMRTKTTPINRRSTFQSSVRSILQNLSQAWRNITQSQRDAWNAAAQDVSRTNIFGNAYHPTGKNYFQLVNTNLSLTGAVPVSAPPSPTPAVSLTAVVVNTMSTSSIVLAGDPDTVPADNAYMVEATRSLSAGKGVAGSEFRKIAIVDDGEDLSDNLFAAYSTKFGAPQSGKKIFFRVTPIQKISGVRGGAVTASGLVA